MERTPTKVIVIGAGIGGLAAALQLSHAGCAVTVIERHAAPGGKIRTMPSAAGPVDAGPTVITLREVFAKLFADVGEDMGAHLTLSPLTTLARHYWSDGTMLDLMADQDHSIANVAAVFGDRAAADFASFSRQAKRLFAAFEGPMMATAQPSLIQLTGHVLRAPQLISDMAPHRSLAGLLARRFREPKLAQLFGRYATYVGGMPRLSPAILSLIWEAEARGVWLIEGGIIRLADVLTELAKARGAAFRFNTPATRIVQQGGRVSGVETPAGLLPADMVLFNGDPCALQAGLLGSGVAGAIPPAATEPRSLSAYVHAFAARPMGPRLAHHTVFFGNDPSEEFDSLQQGRLPGDPTLYICAQDHGRTERDALQRFEIIMNGPSLSDGAEKEKSQCQTLIFDRLRDFGLQFDPIPGPETLTTPAGFAILFPASQGSLYGRSPRGLMAAFHRPTARTVIPGLYLCGGGTHPGAGVPMATLSGRHAAGAMLTDRGSTSTSRPAATPGGTSMGAAPAAPRQSLS